jgi:hypothetical protein
MVVPAPESVVIRRGQEGAQTGKVRKADGAEVDGVVGDGVVGENPEATFRAHT